MNHRRRPRRSLPSSRPARAGIATLVFTLLLPLIAACAGNHPDSKPAASHVIDTTGMAQNLSQLNDAALMKLSPGLLQQIRKDGSAYQVALVADDSLTLDEYEQAELAYASCIQAAGYQLQPGSTELTGLARIDVAVGRFTGLAAEQKADGECRGQYVSAIDLPWAFLTQAIAQRVTKESRHFMATCVLSQGMSIGQASEGPWGPSDPGLAAKYQTCVEQMEAKYNIHTSFGVEGDESYEHVPNGNSSTGVGAISGGGQ